MDVLKKITLSLLLVACSPVIMFFVVSLIWRGHDDIMCVTKQKENVERDTVLASGYIEVAEENSEFTDRTIHVADEALNKE